MSVPAGLDVAEDKGTVQGCATLSLKLDTEVDIYVTLATWDGTGMTLC